MERKDGSREVRGVPMKRGDFKAAQREKCERDSARVRSPLPTSSMSASLWPQKLVLCEMKEARFRMRRMDHHSAGVGVSVFVIEMGGLGWWV